MFIKNLQFKNNNYIIWKILKFENLKKCKIFKFKKNIQFKNINYIISIGSIYNNDVPQTHDPIRRQAHAYSGGLEALVMGVPQAENRS